MMSPFWMVVASNAVVAGGLAVGAWLIGRVWRNPAAVHLLWLAVLIKLFTPPIARLPVPAGVDPTAGAAIAKPRPPREASSVRHRPVVARTAVASPLPARHERAEARPLPPTVTASPIGSPSVTAILAMAWLVGSAGLALGYAVRIGRFARAIRSFEEVPEEVRLLVGDLSARVGLHRPPEARTTDLTVPPLVWSMGGPPRLILPRRLFDGLGPEGRASILLHELAHIRRRDHLVRLLELASKVAFWWHPAVWWAARNLRDLEEECCDGRVVELSPHLARSYALALLDTFDFLSGPSRSAVPLPTAVRPGLISRRIHMLAHPRSARLRARAALVVSALVLPPLALAFAASPAPRQEDTTPASPATAEKKPAPAIVGRVRDEEGAPLVGALVRAVVPAADQRREPLPEDAQVFEVRTDADGNYRLDFPGIEAPTTATLDVLKPGYMRATGPLYIGEGRRYRIVPGGEAPASFQLPPALYFKGVVIDEEGEPVAAAGIFADLHEDLAGPIEQTWTAEDGSFALHNYVLILPGVASQARRTIAPLRVTHPDHIPAVLDNLLTIPEADRESLRVVLPRGAVLSGTVMDAAGGPAAGVVVRAYSEGNPFRAAIADARGVFRLAGIEKAKVKLSVVSPQIGQKVEQEIQVNGDISSLSLRLRPMNLPTNPRTYEVLGLKLADLDPKFQSAYESGHPKGALILDPGDDPNRLGIGRLAKGYIFWMVGDEWVGSVREFLKQVIDEAEAQTASPAPVCVVYEFHSEESDGNMTRYLHLSQADIDSLKEALARLD